MCQAKKAMKTAWTCPKNLKGSNVATFQPSELEAKIHCESGDEEFCKGCKGPIHIRIFRIIED